MFLALAMVSGFSCELFGFHSRSVLPFLACREGICLMGYRSSAPCGVYIANAHVQEAFAQQSVSFQLKTNAQSALRAVIPYAKVYDLKVPYTGPLQIGQGFTYDSHRLSTLGFTATECFAIIRS